jgi:hypothetical protein
VFPNVDYIFITALAVIMDEVHRVRKWRRDVSNKFQASI